MVLVNDSCWCQLVEGVRAFFTLERCLLRINLYDVRSAPVQSMRSMTLSLASLSRTKY